MGQGLHITVIHNRLPKTCKLICRDRNTLNLFIPAQQSRYLIRPLFRLQ